MTLQDVMEWRRGRAPRVVRRLAARRRVKQDLSMTVQEFRLKLWASIANGALR